MKHLACIAAAFSLIASDAAAQEAVVLAPVSEWVLDYDDDSCALKRQFGADGKEAYLEIRQFGPERPLQFIVGSADFARRSGGFSVALRPMDAEPTDMRGFNIRLGQGYEGKLFSFFLHRPDAELLAAAKTFAEQTWALTDEQRRAVLAAHSVSDTRAAERLARDPDFQDGSRVFNTHFRRTEAFLRQQAKVEGEVQSIFIAGAFDKPLLLMTGALHAPMNAMRTCLDELMSHWNVDVEAHRTLVREVMPIDYARWVKEIQKEYPRRMARQQKEGYLHVRLDVSPDGAPTGCFLQSPLNDDDFERVACNNLLRHAKFVPALDARGEPMASFYQTSIVYVLGR